MNYLEINLDSYGLTFASQPLYFNLSWVAVVVIVAVVTGRTLWKAYKPEPKQELCPACGIYEPYCTCEIPEER